MLGKYTSNSTDILAMSFISTIGVVFHVCNSRLINKYGASRLHHCQQFEDRISKKISHIQDINSDLAKLLNEYEKRLREHEDYLTISASVKEMIKRKDFEAAKDFENLIRSYFIITDVPKLHDDWIMMTMLVTADVVGEFIEQTDVNKAVQYTQLLHSMIVRWSQGHSFYGPQLFRNWMKISDRILDPARVLSLIPNKVCLMLPGIPGPPLTQARPSIHKTVLTATNLNAYARTEQQRKLSDLRYRTASVVFTFIINRARRMAPDKNFKEFESQCNKMAKCTNGSLMSIMNELANKTAVKNTYRLLRRTASAKVRCEYLTQSKTKELVTFLTRCVLPGYPPFSEDLVMTCCLLTCDFIVYFLYSDEVDRAVDLLRRTFESVFLIEKNVEAISIALSKIEADPSQLLKTNNYDYEFATQNDVLEPKAKIFSCSSKKRKIDQFHVNQKENTSGPEKRKKLAASKPATPSVSLLPKSAPVIVRQPTPKTSLDPNHQKMLLIRVRTKQPVQFCGPQMVRREMSTIPQESAKEFEMLRDTPHSVLTTGQNNFSKEINSHNNILAKHAKTNPARTITTSIAAPTAPGIPHTSQNRPIPCFELLEEVGQSEDFQQYNVTSSPNNGEDLEYNNFNSSSYNRQESRHADSQHNQTSRMYSHKIGPPSHNAFPDITDNNLEENQFNCNETDELSRVNVFPELNIPAQQVTDWGNMNSEPSFNSGNLWSQPQNQQVVSTETGELTADNRSGNIDDTLQDILEIISDEMEKENTTNLSQQQSFAPENICDRYPNIADFPITIAAPPDEVLGRTLQKRNVVNSAKHQFLSENVSAEHKDVLAQAMTELDGIVYNCLVEEEQI